MQQLKLGRSHKQIDQTAQKALLAICIFICLHLAFFKLTLDFGSIASSAHIFCDYHLIYRPEDTEPSKFKPVLHNTSTQLSSCVSRRRC